MSGPSLFLLAMAASQLTVLASNGAATVAGLRNSLQLAGHYAHIIDATSELLDDANSPLLLRSWNVGSASMTSASATLAQPPTRSARSTSSSPPVR